MTRRYDKKDKAALPFSCSNNKSKIKNDVFLILFILFFVLLFTLLIFVSRNAGDTVIVTVDGQFFGEYSLNENVIQKIQNNQDYNLLIIEDGEAHVKYASCPDGICSHHRPIKYDGECIICLPNKVVIEVHSSDKSQPDIIS